MAMITYEHERQESMEATTREQEPQMVCPCGSTAVDNGVDFEILLIERALEEQPSFPMEQRRAARANEPGDFEILLIEDALREAEERLCSSYELPNRRTAPRYQDRGTPMQSNSASDLDAAFQRQ